MNDQPVERTRHISITRTAADGTVSQTEVHITAVRQSFSRYRLGRCVGPDRRAYRYGGRLF